MVRVIALALLLANLLYFAWAEWIGVPAQPTTSSIAGLPRLTLVSELPPAKRAALAQKMALAAAPPVCVSVGPFEDPAIAAKAAALLQAKSFAPQQRAAQGPAVRRFWVYLDGFTSSIEVTRALHRLEHGGIDDAEAMPPEGGHRQISLGLYSDRALAEHRAKAVRAMGLEPRMGQRMVPGTVFWLDLKLANSSVSVPLQDVSGLAPGGGSSPISVQPCPSGAGSTTPAGAPQGASGPQGTSPAAPPLPASVLPRCKPGGRGPAPCIASEKRDLNHPSVL